MKKMMISVFLAAWMLSSCSKTAIPTFSDTKSLANAIYEESGFDMSAVYAEDFKSTSAFAFGISMTDYENAAKNGVVLRPSIDDKGQTLYVFEMKSAADARRLAEKISKGYEWAPCDNAEKLTIACAEEYLMLFKSTKEEVEDAVTSFRRLSGGGLAFRKDIANVG